MCSPIPLAYSWVSRVVCGLSVHVLIRIPGKGALLGLIWFAAHSVMEVNLRLLTILMDCAVIECVYSALTSVMQRTRSRPA